MNPLNQDINDLDFEKEILPYEEPPIITLAKLFSPIVSKVNANERRSRSSPLIEACKQNDTHLIRFLVSEGADVNCVDYYDGDQVTPLWCLILSDKVSVSTKFDNIKFLVESGANANYVDDNDYSNTSILMHAVQSGVDAEIVEFLIKSGADISVPNVGNCKAIHYATKNLEVLKLLILYGADPEDEDNDGNRLIHHAIFDKSDVIIKYLIGLEANLDAKNVKGISPRDLIS